MCTDVNSDNLQFVFLFTIASWDMNSLLATKSRHDHRSRILVAKAPALWACLESINTQVCGAIRRFVSPFHLLWHFSKHLDLVTQGNSVCWHCSRFDLSVGNLPYEWNDLMKKLILNSFTGFVRLPGFFVFFCVWHSIVPKFTAVKMRTQCAGGKKVHICYYICTSCNTLILVSINKHAVSHKTGNILKFVFKLVLVDSSIF